MTAREGRDFEFPLSSIFAPGTWFYLTSGFCVQFSETSAACSLSHSLATKSPALFAHQILNRWWWNNLVSTDVFTEVQIKTTRPISPKWDYNAWILGIESSLRTKWSPWSCLGLQIQQHNVSSSSPESLPHECEVSLSFLFFFLAPEVVVVYMWQYLRDHRHEITRFPPLPQWALHT